jgi:hypothetical protein
MIYHLLSIYSSDELSSRGVVYPHTTLSISQKIVEEVRKKSQLTLS